MKRIAIYPGTFDPLTNGHVDLVNRALKMFDLVYFLVATNASKKSFFSVEERLKMAKETFAEYDNVIVDFTSDLTTRYAKEKGAIAIIRGLRAVTDFEYEFSLAAVNEYLDKDIEMVFLMSTRTNGFISSSNVKELFTHNHPLDDLVPQAVSNAFKRKLEK